jgi:hypothetical protein
MVTTNIQHEFPNSGAVFDAGQDYEKPFWLTNMARLLRWTSLKINPVQNSAKGGLDR